jgi:hypothetical protein
VSGYGQFAAHYLAAGWSPLPLPHGAKKSPPQGWTGYEGPWPTPEQVAAWAAEYSDGNIALRLPPNVVGIDYDAYKADGVETMQRLTAELGPLPVTWRSSSRGNTPSGIYFYRLPDGLPRIGDVGHGIETIRYGHRYAVVGPSTHPGDEKTPPGGIYTWYAPNGTNKAPAVTDLPWLPGTWVQHLVDRGERKMDAKPQATTSSAAYNELDPAEKQRVDAYVKRTLEGIASDLAESVGWGENEHDSLGRGWEKLQADKALRLAALAKADWNDYTLEQAHTDFVDWAPTGGGWTGYDVEQKFIAQARRAAPADLPPATQRADIFAGLERPVNTLDGPAAAANATPADHGHGAPMTRALVAGQPEQLNVGNPAKVVDWLRSNLGTGPLSGIFARGADVVFTPRIGAEGYIEPRAGQAEGTASISVLNAAALSARVQARYDCVLFKKAEGGGWNTTPHLFPRESALHAISAPEDFPALRELGSVTHSPTFRADGTLISAPGYDPTTRSLFLPTGGQPTVAIPEHPTAQEVATARGWIDYMLQDFRFVGPDDLANYVGLMLTPLLREMVPPPYKLGVIEAHQPGSGKTFLARALMSIHSGVMHAEMPTDEAELVKTITSILDVSTGSVVVFDNVTGVVRSATLAGLLTSNTFQGRRLGTGTLVEAANDRLWIVTGNNAALGGDLPRRSLRVRIDPRVPHPERRTQFAIADFEGWVREHRGDLLWSLLTLVRHWVSVGSPVPDQVRADSYGRWDAVVGSILACAGYGGIFDDPAANEDVDPDFEEWAALLAGIESVFGGNTWTAKDVLQRVRPLGIDIDPTGLKPLPFDILPGSMLDGRAATVSPATLGRTFGRHLRNREGRWFGPLSVRRAGDGRDSILWVLDKS